MRFLFDLASMVVLLLAITGIVGGLVLGGVGVLAMLNADDPGIGDAVVVFWGIGAITQGCLLALVASYCRLRVASDDRHGSN